MGVSITEDELAEHGASLRRLARRLVQPELAEDLVQETYVAALEHEGETRAPGRWLRGVLRNRAKMTLRAQGRRRAREAEVIVGGAELDPEELSRRAQAYRIVLARVEALDEPFRSTIFMHFFDGLSLADIARRSDTPSGTVRWRLKTGLDRLRAELDEQYGARELWSAALLPLPALGPAPTTLVAKVAIMKLSTKLLIAVPVLAGASMLVASAASEEGHADEGAVDVAVAEAETKAPVRRAKPPESPPPSSSPPPASAPASKKPVPRFPGVEQRDARVRALERARAQRMAEYPDEDPRPEIPAIDYAQHIDDQVELDLLQFVNDCSAIVDEKVEGTLFLRFHITWEPEIGGIIEGVDAKSRLEQPEVAECIHESAYMLDMPAYPEPGRTTFSIQLQLAPR